MRSSLATVSLLFAAAFDGSAQTPPPPPPCALKDTAGNTCVERQNKVGKIRRVCHLYVGVLPSQEVYVFPYKLSTAGPPPAASAAPKTIIVWHLLDPGYEFVEAGGPLQLKSDDEFDDGRPTDEMDGDPEENAPHPPKGRAYRIRYLNTKQNTYDYTISISKGGTPKTCDPRIVNDGN